MLKENATKSVQRVFVFLICIMFLFSALMEPVEGAMHDGADLFGIECCLVCHPAHSGCVDAPVEGPLFLSKLSSEVCLEESLHHLESPVFSLFHPPKNLG